MANCWSLSTTIRNPERNAPFLRVLSEFEGQLFDLENQAKLFKRLIQTKNYTPNGLPKRIKDKYEDPEEFTDEELEEILSIAKYENKTIDSLEEIYAMRGRTAVSNLNKMCAAVARDSHGPVRITSLGKEILSGSPDFSNIFLRYFLKWQLPNLGERGFADFDIIPFIATMHVVNKVNQQWELLGNNSVGISKVEFALFLPSLIDYKDIDNVVREIINFRHEVRSLNANDSKEFIDKAFRDKVISVFNIDSSNEEEIEKKVNNLYDYADSAIRYFRMTNLFYYRGNDRYVDLSPRREVEVKKILENFSGESLEFKVRDDYYEYMADINMPQLPWENLQDLQNSLRNLRLESLNLQSKIDNEYPNQHLHKFDYSDEVPNDISNLNREISKVREDINLLNVDYSILVEKSLSNVDTYISEIEKLATRRRALSGQDPLNLEWNVAQSLMALDDAREIIPHYNVGDDNLPLFTAPGNIHDMECHYNDFSMICEVTLLKGRDQWYNEGQPVMRHLRSFEDSNSHKESYCLFLAPTLHQDTVNTFWFSVKYEYEGSKQKIIPMTLQQYTKVLRLVKKKNDDEGIRINQSMIKALMDTIYSKVEVSENSNAWIMKIDDCIDEWDRSIC